MAKQTLSRRHDTGPLARVRPQFHGQPGAWPVLRRRPLKSKCSAPVAPSLAPHNHHPAIAFSAMPTASSAQPPAPAAAAGGRRRAGSGARGGPSGLRSRKSSDRLHTVGHASLPRSRSRGSLSARANLGFMTSAHPSQPATSSSATARSRNTRDALATLPADGSGAGAADADPHDCDDDDDRDALVMSASRRRHVDASSVQPYLQSQAPPQPQHQSPHQALAQPEVQEASSPTPSSPPAPNSRPSATQVDYLVARHHLGGSHDMPLSDTDTSTAVPSSPAAPSLLSGAASDRTLLDRERPAAPSAGPARDEAERRHGPNRTPLDPSEPIPPPPVQSRTSSSSATTPGPAVAADGCQPSSFTDDRSDTTTASTAIPTPDPPTSTKNQLQAHHVAPSELPPSPPASDRAPALTTLPEQRTSTAHCSPTTRQSHLSTGTVSTAEPASNAPTALKEYKTHTAKRSQSLLNLTQRLSNSYSSSPADLLLQRKPGTGAAPALVSNTNATRSVRQAPSSRQGGYQGSPSDAHISPVLVGCGPSRPADPSQPLSPHVVSPSYGHVPRDRTVSSVASLDGSGKGKGHADSPPAGWTPQSPRIIRTPADATGRGVQTMPSSPVQSQQARIRPAPLHSSFSNSSEGPTAHTSGTQSPHVISPMNMRPSASLLRTATTLSSAGLGEDSIVSSALLGENQFTSNIPRLHLRVVGPYSPWRPGYGAVLSAANAGMHPQPDDYGYVRAEGGGHLMGPALPNNDVTEALLEPVLNPPLTGGVTVPEEDYAHQGLPEWEHASHNPLGMPMYATQALVTTNETCVLDVDDLPPQLQHYAQPTLLIDPATGEPAGDEMQHFTQPSLTLPRRTARALALTYQAVQQARPHAVTRTFRSPLRDSFARIHRAAAGMPPIARADWAFEPFTVPGNKMQTRSPAIASPPTSTLPASVSASALGGLLASANKADSRGSQATAAPTDPSAPPYYASHLVKQAQGADEDALQELARRARQMPPPPKPGLAGDVPRPGLVYGTRPVQPSVATDEKAARRAALAPSAGAGARTSISPAPTGQALGSIKRALSGVWARAE